MTLQDAIKKVVEGGWKFKEDYFIGALLKNSQFLLERDFWQALGKSMGWEDEQPGHDGKSTLAIDYSLPRQQDWLFYWHCFIDHLAEGKDINSFFETLS